MEDRGRPLLSPPMSSAEKPRVKRRGAVLVDDADNENVEPRMRQLALDDPAAFLETLPASPGDDDEAQLRTRLFLAGSGSGSGGSHVRTPGRDDSPQSPSSTPAAAEPQAPLLPLHSLQFGDEEDAARARRATDRDPWRLEPYRVVVPDSVADSVRRAYIAAYEQQHNAASPFSFHVGAGRITGVDAFHEGECPLTERFSITRTLGRGAYGFVFEVHLEQPRVAALPTRRYALKLQRMYYPRDAITGDIWPLQRWNFEAGRGLSQAEKQTHTARNELQVHVLLNELRHPNVIVLYDWVRSVWSPPAELALDAEWRLKLGKADIYQMSISELADGTLYDVLARHVSLLPSERAQLEFMRGALAQVFCTLLQLDRRVRFVHGDLSPLNVLVSRVDFVAEDSLTGLFYALDATNTSFVYVPLYATQYALMKLNDFGFSHAYYRDTDAAMVLIHNQMYRPAHSPAKGDVFKLVELLDMCISRLELSLRNHDEWRQFVARMTATSHIAPTVAVEDAFFASYKKRLSAADVRAVQASKRVAITLYADMASQRLLPRIERER